MGFFIKRHILVSPEFRNNRELFSMLNRVDAHRLAVCPDRVFKSDSKSTVAELLVDRTRLVIKFYRAGSWAKAVCRALGKSQAVKCREGAGMLKALGVDTVEPVAVVEDRIGWICLRSLFVVKYLFGVNARDYFSNDRISEAEKGRMAKKIIDSIVCFHDSGIVHGDTKDLNMFIREGTVAWLDLDTIARPKWKVAEKRRKRKDWRTLLYNWSDSPDVQRLFIKSLFDRFGGPFVKRVIRDLVERRREKIVQYRKEGNFPGADSEMLRALNLEIQELLNSSASNDWRVFRSSPGILMAEKAVEGSGNNSCPAFFCKIVTDPCLLGRFGKVSRPNKMRHGRITITAKLMQAVGLHTPEAIFSGRIGGAVCLVSRGMSGASIEDCLRKCAAASDGEARKKGLLRALGQEIGYMHACGFVHGDLDIWKIRINMEKGEPRICLLFNEQACYYKKTPARKVIDELSGVLNSCGAWLGEEERATIVESYEQMRRKFEAGA